MQGFAFFFLAIVYCSLAFLVVQKIGIENLKNDEKHQNTFYTISAIGVSLFSLAVAFVFAEHKEIISIIWLLEASVFFFLAEKTKSAKIALAAIIFLIIGIARILPFLGSSLRDDYGMLVALLIITASLVCNLFLLFRNDKSEGSQLSFEHYGAHNFFHIIGMATVAIL